MIWCRKRFGTNQCRRRVIPSAQLLMRIQRKLSWKYKKKILLHLLRQPLRSAKGLRKKIGKKRRETSDIAEFKIIIMTIIHLLVIAEMRIMQNCVQWMSIHRQCCGQLIHYLFSIFSIHFLLWISWSTMATIRNRVGKDTTHTTIIHFSVHTSGICGDARYTAIYRTYRYYNVVNFHHIAPSIDWTLYKQFVVIVF